MDMPVIRVAVLDMYDRVENQGMRGIRSLLYLQSKKVDAQVRWHVFDVRHAGDMPDDSYDIYISSGGPGSPLESNLPWEKKYFKLMDDLWEYNLHHTDRKKHVFLICHSFQLMCRHKKIGVVTKRKSPTFGIFPIHKTETGLHDSVFSGLPDPFYATDSREYQVIQPDWHRIRKEGYKILAIEKDRPHVPLERALMSIRFSEEFFGTQFHPEADPHGMIRYFTRADKKEAIIKNYGEDKYYKMVDMLDDPDKIVLTQSSVIPAFLSIAFEKVLQTAVYV